MISQITKLVFTFLFLTILNFSVFPQNNQSTLSGRVSDANGGGIAGAKVVLKKQDIRFEKIVLSDNKGEFSFADVSSGIYRVSVFAEGFAETVETVEIGKTNNLDIILPPAEIAEYVSVTSNHLAGTPEALEQIPGSIELVDKQTLEKSRVHDFGEALRKVSGISVRDEEGFGLRPNISIRGTNPTRSTKVLLLEDGIPLAYAPYGDNASYYHPPVERFESIEVLKGSGQIGYGPVTVAGVVNYLTPNPTEEQEIWLKLQGGNRSFFKGNAGYSNTFGNTGVLFNFTRKQGEGARENIRLGLNDFFAKVVQPVNDKNILTGKFSYFGERSNLTYSGLTEAEFAANPRYNPFRNDFFYTNRFGTSLSHTAVFTPKASLTTNFYANNFSRHWWRQSSNSSQRPFRLGSDPDCLGMQDLNTTCGNLGNLRNYWAGGIEPRLTLNFDLGEIRNELNAGFRYHYEDQHRVQKLGDLPDSRDGVITENNERKANAVSGFLQNRFVWKDFSFTPGVRIENIRYSRTNRLGGSVKGKTELTEIIPGFGIAYNAFGNTTIFAGVHRGFAPPAVADILTDSGGGIELDSEFSWNYEVGIRTRPVRGLSLASTFFRIDYENQIIPASVAGGIGATVTNAGETLHQGFELNAQIDSNQIFKTDYNSYFQTAYTHLGKAEFSGIRYSSISGFRDVLVTGNRLPYAPENLLNASLGYAYRDFDGFIEANYISSQFSDDLNRANPILNGQAGLIPSQIYWNATANYRVEEWKTTLFVTAKNIFDRTFIVDRSRGILPSNPRIISAGFKVNF
ncbi:MAG TPA: TonB-dependent receptor [Pyrinomonadaceae bacterium]|nr:TonB-dependent receptor [Pyrinomonadaceae bacterium]